MCILPSCGCCVLRSCGCVLRSCGCVPHSCGCVPHSSGCCVPRSCGCCVPPSRAGRLMKVRRPALACPYSSPCLLASTSTHRCAQGGRGRGPKCGCGRARVCVCGVGCVSCASGATAVVGCSVWRCASRVEGGAATARCLVDCSNLPVLLPTPCLVVTHATAPPLP